MGKVFRVFNISMLKTLENSEKPLINRDENIGKNLSFQQFCVENLLKALKTQRFVAGLTEKHVGDEHEAESEKEGISCSSFFAVSVSFGDHLVADHVKHGTSREGKSEGENGFRNTDGKEADERTNYLNHSREGGDNKRLFR